MASAAASAASIRETGKLTPGQWVGFMAMVVGMFMAILDIQIVASSLSQIQSGLSASADEIIWVQTSYLIAEVIMIPLSGWLSRALSTRILFTISCVGFTLMSLMCALAWDLDSMIVFRALQGFIGGAMIPTVFATIFIMFPPKMRITMNVVVGLVVTVAPTAGPVLGGYLTDVFSWHAMFLINIIPGIIAATCTWLFVKVDEPDWELLKKIDFLGIFYIALFLGSLQYVLEEGVRKDWFSSNEIMVFGVMALVGCVLTFWHQFTTEHPIVEFKAFRNRNYAAGCFYSFILGWGMFSALSIQPMFLAQVRGLDSFQIGTYLMVTGAFQLLSAPMAGNLARVVDPRVMLGFGMALFGLGTWMNGHLTSDSAFWELFLPQAVRGMSLMFCFVPISNLALGTLPLDQIKNASGLYNLTRNLGGAIGLAVVSTLQLKWNHFYMGQLREHVTAGSVQTQDFLANIGARMGDFPLQNPDQAALQTLYQTVLRQANVLTFNSLFETLAVMFFCAVPLVFLFKPVKAPKPGADGGGH